MQKLDDLLEVAISNASASTAQVVQVVKEYLETSPSDLLNVFNSSKIHFGSVHNVVTPSNACHEYILRSDDSPLRINSQTDFRVIATGLPIIILEDCHQFTLDLSGLNIRMATHSRAKIQITLINCSNFVITGGKVANSRNFLCAYSCQQFSLTGIELRECEGYGIIIADSSFFQIENCSFVNGLAAGIYCLGETSYGMISGNRFSGASGFLNCDAGLHINHCTPNLDFGMIPDQSHEDAKITEKIKKPKFIFVEGNSFSYNRAQGIYCEGALFCSFKHNVIHSNNKEGVCFDWGCAFNLFTNNSLAFNGQRSSLSQQEIKVDAIEQYPLLLDGSSSCKLPALSIDNGSFNIIASNSMFRNFGGGLKMVRSGISNVIAFNTFSDNCIGINEHFRAFHGLTLLAMGSETEFNPDCANLDFLPSKGNIISGNTFAGSHSYQAFYAVPSCSSNQFLDDNLCLDGASPP